MFEQLFEQPWALARHVNGPMADERRRFLISLAEQGMLWGRLRTVAGLLLQIIHRLDLVNRPNQSISREEIVLKLRASRSQPSVAVRWLRFLDRFEQPIAPFCPYTKEVDVYVDFLRNERGAAESTIKANSQFLRRFLGQVRPQDRPFSELTVTQIDEALLALLNQKGYARGSVASWAGRLKTFFRYAATQNWCPPTLAEAIRRPRLFREESLPNGPCWDDVQRLFKLTEGDRPADIRDRAILMLLAIYGLRSGEVRRLTLDDFHWEQELLTVVCPKTRRTRSYPLIRSVGDAVLRYLQELRPQSEHREVFLTLRPPIGPLRAALFSIVSTRLKRLGISLTHYGPHALRHACAIQLLNQGLSLKEIGDQLGHQHPNTTRIYAKVDLTGLRQVADFDLGGLI